jgi:hypothetical protein
LHRCVLRRPALVHEAQLVVDDALNVLRSAPRLTHICAGTRPQLRRD